MPCALKITVLKSFLKKQDADFEQLQDFRPISNLTFVSKLIEKASALQLNNHILRHQLEYLVLAVAFFSALTSA